MLRNLTSQERDLQAHSIGVARVCRYVAGFGHVCSVNGDEKSILAALHPCRCCWRDYGIRKRDVSETGEERYESVDTLV